MLKLATKAQYTKAKEQREFVEIGITKLTTEKDELESLRKSKKRTIQIEDIKTTIGHLQETPKARTASEIFDLMNKDIASRIAGFEEKIAKFFVDCQHSGIAYTAGWDLEKVVKAEEKLRFWTVLQEDLEKNSIDEWIDIIDRQIERLTQEVLRHAQNGGNSSTSKSSNLVEDAKIYAAAELVSGSYALDYIKNKISWFSDDVVWEDRDF